MERCFWPVLAFAVAAFMCWVPHDLKADFGADEKTKPVFASKTVTPQTAGHSVKIEADISKAKHLFLVATDAGDGFSFDHCDWAMPTLSGSGISKKLTDLKWKDARCSYGTVNKNKNCVGGPISINGKRFDFGIGTHAHSIIHFELPKGHQFTKFTAIGGIDNSGSDQGAGHQASVQFLVFTEKPPKKYFSGNRTGGNEGDHEIEKAITQFDVHPELEIQLFAGEPMLVNPTNIDIDHLGRVWVCEVVNYRGKRNSRPAGDRILILEDTDGNGKADKQTVFYQGRDIDSVHGICVLGNRVIVSAGSDVFFLDDEDGDSKADKKEMLFTGIGGKQHDHGIHAFVFGPDGKLYFNFGNSGRQIKDKNGEPITDVAGQVVNDRSFPYRQGMVFRCNMDGSEFETLAWNFRNNWEVCVDSFGRMWQSDNDDDGNRGVRINYVMQYGNFGYLDEMDGSGWRTPRTGMSREIPLQHWHLNDPGVVPNLLQTGAGSPTGICFYEGDALPKVFHNQIIHCDAGPSIVRAYPIQADGFGYRATTVNIMDGAKYNKWFRPSDVCVAPDGTLIVADWYDPGVGGHGMGDIERGRLFRVTSTGKGNRYQFEKPDFETIKGAVSALQSPNQATRYLAWQALMEKGTDAEVELRALLIDKNEYTAARALWLLTKLGLPDQRVAQLLKSAFWQKRPLLQETVVKAIMQLNDRATFDSVIDGLYHESIGNLPPNVKRELLIMLSKRQKNKVEISGQVQKWISATAAKIGTDRWALETFGIALESKWDRSLPVILRDVNQFTARRFVWRSRSKNTPALLTEAIIHPSVDADKCLSYFRAFDFQKAESKSAALLDLAFNQKLRDASKRTVVMREALARLGNVELDESQKETISKYVSSDSTPVDERIRLIRQFRIAQKQQELIQYAATNDAVGSQAITTLYEMGDGPAIQKSLAQVPDEGFEKLTSAISRVAKKESIELLGGFAKNKKHPLERRKMATRQLGNLHGGCKTLIQWVNEKSYDSELRPALIAALHNARWDDISKKANELFPISNTKGNKPLPKISDLARRRGNIKNGLAVYKKEGTCAICHLVNGEGKQVGPDLSEIGKKLSKTALYESLLFPSAAISHNYEMWRLTTIEGEMIDGVIKTETDQSITLLDVKGNEHTITKKDIDEKQKQRVSLMPDDLHQAMTEQQLVDLVEYLTTLKKKKE